MIMMLLEVGSCSECFFVFFEYFVLFYAFFSHVNSLMSKPKYASKIID